MIFLKSHTIKQKIQDLHPCQLTSNLMLMPLYNYSLFGIYICGVLYNLQCVFISPTSFDLSYSPIFIVIPIL